MPTKNKVQKRTKKTDLEMLIERIRAYNKSTPEWPWMVLSPGQVNLIDKAGDKVTNALHIRIEDAEGNILSPDRLMALYQAGEERNIAVCHADYFKESGLSPAAATLLINILGYEHAAEGKQVPDYMADAQALAQHWPGIEWMPATKAQQVLRREVEGLVEMRPEDATRTKISTKVWSLLDPDKRGVGMRLTPGYRRELETGGLNTAD
ncbi:MAG: hypothetical protein H0T76_06000 [Nannocystis sp.]|nr:hypothetical protein [Nannocystis sp.]MBA3546013.1 hypothetical protein [Nannocystis sp.]